MRRLVEEVVADLRTEAAPDFSRVSGALKQGNKSEGFHTRMTKIQGVKEGYLRRTHNRHLRAPLILGRLGRGFFPPGHRDGFLGFFGALPNRVAPYFRLRLLP